MSRISDTPQPRRMVRGAIAALVAVHVALLGAGAGWAENSSPLGRALEMPAHRALIASIARGDGAPRRFESDGCSGGLSDVWRASAEQFDWFARAFDSVPPWENCCVVHDRAYHNIVKASDAEASFAARLSADHALEICVAETGIARREALANAYDISPDQIDLAFATMGRVMFWAVRLGGVPCTGLPWRWGFGYRDCSVLGTARD